MARRLSRRASTLLPSMSGQEEETLVARVTSRPSARRRQDRPGANDDRRLSRRSSLEEGRLRHDRRRLVTVHAAVLVLLEGLHGRVGDDPACAGGLDIAGAERRPRSREGRGRAVGPLDVDQPGIVEDRSGGKQAPRECTGCVGDRVQPPPAALSASGPYRDRNYRPSTRRPNSSFERFQRFTLMKRQSSDRTTRPRLQE